MHVDAPAFRRGRCRARKGRDLSWYAFMSAFYPVLESLAAVIIAGVLFWREIKRPKPQKP